MPTGSATHSASSCDAPITAKVTGTRCRISVSTSASAIVAVAAVVPEGAKWVFCQRNVQAARADMTRICAEIREELAPACSAELVGLIGGLAPRGGGTIANPNGSGEMITQEVNVNTQALHDIGYVQTDQNPDYVVLGETRNFNFDNLTKAIRLIGAGSRFIVTNPDATGPSNEGPLPAAGSVAALITKATGMKPYVVGKPNPMMFRSAMRKIGAHSESTGMIGDRMDTDVVAGIEAGLHTVLVLTGIADDAEIAKYPFRPTEILNSVADLI